MTYTIQDWNDGAEGGTPVSAERLTHIEGGIAAADGNALSALAALAGLDASSFGLGAVGNYLQQPYSAKLIEIANLIAPSDATVLFHDAGHWTALSIAGLATELGVTALDSDLTAIAALGPADNDILQRKSGVWANRTPAQFKTDLAYTATDLGLGNVTNTTDAAKPVSTAQQAALDLKQAKVLWAVKGSDQTMNVSSTTLQTVTGLSVALAANKVYRVQIAAIYDTGSAPDIKFGLTYPAGCTGTWFGSPDRNTADTAINMTAADISASLSSGGVSVGTVLAATITAIIHTSSTPGTLQFLAAQDTSNVTAPIIKADSYIEANERG